MHAVWQAKRARAHFEIRRSLDLSEPQALRAFLDHHGLSAKKSLGQHFLCSKRASESIVGAAEGCESILEIGPGPGILTSALVNRYSQVHAIEIDERMKEALADSSPGAQIHWGDALTIDYRSILSQMKKPIGLISNMPYYITGPLLERIAEVRDEIAVAVLMMQREVAQKILAEPGNRDRGSISVFLQSQFEIRSVCVVPGGAFIPPPKVDSQVLKLTPRPNAFQMDFTIVRAAFKQPRKTLLNNLLAANIGEKAELESAIESLGLDVRIRPQIPDLEQWEQLSAMLARARN